MYLAFDVLVLIAKHELYVVYSIDEEEPLLQIELGKSLVNEPNLFSVNKGLVVT